MDFVLDDDTPVVEERSFKEEHVEGHKQSKDAAAAAAAAPATLLDSSSSSGSSSSSSSPPPLVARGKSADDLSNSYHEIFDAQVIPTGSRESVDIGGCADGMGKVQLPCDSTARDTTDYLTNKLVQDSLKWQEAGGSDDDEDDERAADDDLISPRGVDPQVLLDLENDARHLATSVDSLVESLSGVLRNASALSVESVETYRDAVCKTCDEVDGNIKCMYQLMAKVEELNKAMAPAHAMAERLKEIKKLLEVLEGSVGGPTERGGGTSRFKSVMTSSS